MRWLLLSLAMYSFLLYAYAIARVFSHEHGVDWRMRLLRAAGTASALLHLWSL
jgi:hypothetical protein